MYFKGYRAAVRLLLMYRQSCYFTSPDVNYTSRNCSESEPPHPFFTVSANTGFSSGLEEKGLTREGLHGPRWMQKTKRQGQKFSVMLTRGRGLIFNFIWVLGGGKN